MVLSSIAYSLSASALSCSNSRTQTPLAAQRLNLVCTAFHAPNRSGRSRQGMPAR